MNADVGGTHLRIQRDGETRTLPTPQRYKDLVLELAAASDDVNCVSIPGPVLADGTVSPQNAPSPNLGWTGKRLVEDLQERTGSRFYVQRDAYCAALHALRLHGIHSFLLLYPGTGFGFVAVQNGKILRGPHNVGGEVARLEYRGEKIDVVASLKDRPDAETYFERNKELFVFLADLFGIYTFVLGGRLAERGDAARVCEETVKGTVCEVEAVTTNANPLEGAGFLPGSQLEL